MQAKKQRKAAQRAAATPHPSAGVPEHFSWIPSATLHAVWRNHETLTVFSEAPTGYPVNRTFLCSSSDGLVHVAYLKGSAIAFACGKLPKESIGLWLPDAMGVTCLGCVASGVLYTVQR
jgi:hypothetical protein